MAQAERRAKAVVAAAVAWRHGKTDEIEKLYEAVDRYEEAQKALANLPEDPTAFVCPYCGEVRPGYGWNYNAGDTGPFAVAYLTVYCGACKGILSVCVTTFTPSEQMAKALMDQFRSKLVNPS